MASVHKLPGKQNWICFYTDRHGKRRSKSTLTTNKREAQRICVKVQSVEDQARSGNITEEKARRVIEKTVNEIMAECGAPVKSVTIRAHFTEWLKSIERSESTYVRYKGIADAFLAHLDGGVARNLATLRTHEIEAYKNTLKDRVSPGTVNTHMKVIRVALEKAVKLGVFERNPARLVDNVETKDDRLFRRAFTLPELRKLLGACEGDWRTAILVGLYTGLRLGDIQAMTWGDIDLQSGEYRIVTRKTGRVQNHPLAGPLRRHLEELPVADDTPDAPLCPTFQGRAVNNLSNDFYELMASAGLVKSRGDHQKKPGKRGRSARRQMSEISFHALRHTATSLLKNAGVSDVVARDIIGHESEAISQHYTHIETETKRAAVDKMPDVLADL